MNRLWRQRKVTTISGGALTAFSPSQISGLTVWLDASQISGLNNNDPVTTWTDLSGNGNNATQATGSQKPTYKTSGLNGRPVVLFDGVDDKLATAAFSSPLAQPASIYAVVSWSLTGSAYQDPIDGIASGQRMVIAFEVATQKFAMFAGAAVTLGGVASAGASFHLLNAIYNGASSSGFINGVNQPGLSSNPGTEGMTGVLLGDAPIGGQAFSGRIAEVLVYSGAHSATQRQSIETYLNSKWAIY